VISSDIDFVKPKARELHGADVFVESGQTPEVLGKTLEGVVAGSPFKLKVISNRGTKVYPLMGTSTECVDAYQCRFVAVSGTTVTHEQIQDLLAKISTKYVWSHVEKLQAFDGALGYTKSQGED
jgi:isocitrate dehydrogenase